MLSFLIGGALLFMGAFFLILFISMRCFQIHHKQVYYRTLPPKLGGLKILQLSDLHNRSQSSKTIDIWDAVFAESFDLAVITGDLIFGHVDHLRPHFADLQKLAKRVPTFFVEGNHDVKYANQLTTLMSQLNITYLKNDCLTIQLDGFDDTFDLIGTRDFIVLQRSGFADLAPLMQRSHAAFKLILTHQPQTFDYFKSHIQNALVLSGHTHGGQIRLPFVKTLFAPNQGIFPKYGAGFYDDPSRTSMLYVSRGIGATRFPFRFWNRPEITIFELKKGEL